MGLSPFSGGLRLRLVRSFRQQPVGVAAPLTESLLPTPRRYAAIPLGLLLFGPALPLT